MNTNFLNSVTNFLKKRTFEFIGLILISMSIGLAIAFTTYSPEDPSFVDIKPLQAQNSSIIKGVASVINDATSKVRIRLV